MYPQQPQYPAQPQQPQYPQQPQSPGPYAPQPSPAPQPQQPPAYPPQFVAPPSPQQFAPQYGQFPQNFAPPTPVQPSVPGTIDQFYSQPSTGGGKALAFESVGTSYTGIVTRPIGDGDISQQTDAHGRPQFFRDGRPKFVMKVPLQIEPTPAYPDGLAQWYVKGVARDELVRAMAEVGAPDGPPEPGAIITVTMTGTRPSGPGMSPTKLVQVTYRRPGQNATAATPPQPQTAPVTSTASGQSITYQQPVPTPYASAAPAYAPPPAYAPNGSNNGSDPQTSTHLGNGSAPQPGYQPAPAPGYAPPVSAPSTSTAPPSAELSPDQQALLAKLTGQYQPTA